MPAPSAPTYAWQAPPPPGAVSPGVAGLEYAGVAGRLVAWFLDWIIVGLISLLALIPIVIASDGDATTIAYTIAFIAIDAAYHVWLWTSRMRATLGQRLLKLQVGEATTGRTLTSEEALRRWAALGSPLYLIGIIPAIAGLGTFLWIVWVVLLLISTGTSPTRQGLHDRFAGSAVVQPSGQGSSGIVLGCLIIIGLLVILPLLTIIFLIFIGSQMSDILSRIGTSI